MILQAFGFCFSIMGSLLGIFFNAKLENTISIGGLILFVFFLSFLIGSLYGMARSEFDSYGDYDRSSRVRTTRTYQRKEKESKMGRHAFHQAKHGRG